MKNIQVIDGADNCTYDVFSASDADFKAIFPARGQDIEFIEDFWKRLGAQKAKEISTRLYANPPVDKKTIRGIHGTLFYQLRFKKRYYPTKRESQMVSGYEPVAAPPARQKTRRRPRAAGT